MTTPLPSAHEPLPADFLRKYGPQKDMKWRNRHCPNHPFVLFLEPKMLLDALDTTDFEFIGPLGTIAAATTPLPERECDCGGLRGEAEHIFATVHSSSCSIHRPYHHILPHALAALPEKPGGLIVSRAGLSNWDDIEQFFGIATWTDYKRWLQLDTEHAYAVPAQSGQGKGTPELEDVQMMLCESVHLGLRPGIRYTFLVHPTCKECRKLWLQNKLPEQPTIPPNEYLYHE